MIFKQELADLLHSYRWDETLGVPASAIAEYVRGDLQTLSNFIAVRDCGGILGPLGAKLDNIERLLINNQKLEDSIIMDLTKIQAGVEDTLTVEDSAMTLITNIAAEIKAANGDQTTLNALADKLEAEKATLADLIIANTPADTAGSTTGSEGADGSGTQG